MLDYVHCRLYVIDLIFGVWNNVMQGDETMSSVSLKYNFVFCYSVAAMNNLYRMLESPPLEGWTLVGGDPCGDNWQGVTCVFTNITGL